MDEHKLAFNVIVFSFFVFVHSELHIAKKKNHLSEKKRFIRLLPIIEGEMDQQTFVLRVNDNISFN